MAAYYNEIDAYAAAMLRELIKAGEIAPGVVDERSITEITAADLEGYTQIHFFAGVGVWSYALREAGWPDDVPVWTGSCPCQGYSSAGKQLGDKDPRHLWPVWIELIREARPNVIFGEQVSTKAVVGAASKKQAATGWDAGGVDASVTDAWIDAVSTDLESANYACAPFDIPASCVGAPTLRQRLFFVATYEGLASPTSEGLEEREQLVRSDGRAPEPAEGQATIIRGYAGNMGNTDGQRGDWRADIPQPTGWTGAEADGSLSELASTYSDRLKAGLEVRLHGSEHDAEYGSREISGKPSATNGFWANADWLYCRDDRWRAVRPGSFPLAHGVTGRVDQLRCFGNAINGEVATLFIATAMKHITSHQ